MKRIEEFTVLGKTLRVTPFEGSCTGCAAYIDDEGLLCTAISDYIAEKNIPGCVGNSIIYKEVEK